MLRRSSSPFNSAFPLYVACSEVTLAKNLHCNRWLFNFKIIGGKSFVVSFYVVFQNAIHLRFNALRNTLSEKNQMSFTTKYGQGIFYLLN